MDVGIRNRDMFRAGEDHPAWLGPAHEVLIEDEQVDEAKDFHAAYLCTPHRLAMSPCEKSGLG